MDMEMACGVRSKSGVQYCTVAIGVSNVYVYVYRGNTKGDCKTWGRFCKRGKTKVCTVQ